MNYTKHFSVSQSLNIMGTAIKTLSLNGPISYYLYLLFIQQKYLEVIEFQFDYSFDTSVDDFISARQIQAFLNKQDFLDLGVDKEKKAWDSFIEMENHCRNTNERFRNQNVGVNPPVAAILFIAQRKIAQILGSCPSFTDLDFQFGPGATTNVKKARSNPRVKLEALITCSTNVATHVKEYLALFPLWRDHHICNDELKLQLSHGSLQFVPKTSTSLRSIGVEPTLNGLLQGGIGRYLKKRLKYAGVDLSDQGRNQKLAFKGSIDNSLATIDLSSASDTISYNLVLSLLPLDWFNLLDSCRTPTMQYKDKVINLEKFSSMGNSYTFELESLIFYCLSYATCVYHQLDTDYVSVYGDDIIIPLEAYDTLSDVLTYCGFFLNVKKSFKSGPFRESCGVDYFRGIDIRPFYLKDRINVRTLFHAHNWFFRNFNFEIASLLLNYIPSHHRIFGPDGYGDGHLLGSYKLRSSRRLRRDGWEGGFFDTYTSVTRKINLPECTDYLYPCYSIYVIGDSPGLDSIATDHNVVPGSCMYKRLSIYTLKRSIFSY